MLSVLVRSRAAAPRLNRASVQRVPRVVPSTSDAVAQRDRLPEMPRQLARGAGEPSPGISSGAPLSIGSLVYLGSVGLVAAGIVAVFFGAGFFLLAPVAGGTTSGPIERAGPEAISPLPSPGDVEQQAFVPRASARENKDAALNFAAFPAPTEAPAIDGKEGAPQLNGILASTPHINASNLPANAPVPGAPTAAAIAPAPPTPGFSSAETAELLAHGDALLRNGDVASARLFYERAAGAGDARAALRLGASFDAEFLSRLGLGKLQANPAEAQSWYRRARDLGMIEAKRQLNSLGARQGE